jgi:hypothetical protein
MERSGVCLRGAVFSYTYRRAAHVQDFTPLIGRHHYQTPTATTYGTQHTYRRSDDGAKTFAGSPRYSIEQLALRGELYTGQTERGRLDPSFVEWIQGFPEDWTQI